MEKDGWMKTCREEAKNRVNKETKEWEELTVWQHGSLAMSCPLFQSKIAQQGDRGQLQEGGEARRVEA